MRWCHFILSICLWTSLRMTKAWTKNQIKWLWKGKLIFSFLILSIGFSNIWRELLMIQSKLWSESWQLALITQRVPQEMEIMISMQMRRRMTKIMTQWTGIGTSIVINHHRMLRIKIWTLSQPKECMNFLWKWSKILLRTGASLRSCLKTCSKATLNCSSTCTTYLT